MRLSLLGLRFIEGPAAFSVCLADIILRQTRLCPGQRGQTRPYLECNSSNICLEWKSSLPIESGVEGRGSHPWSAANFPRVSCPASDIRAPVGTVTWSAKMAAVTWLPCSWHSSLWREKGVVLCEQTKLSRAWVSVCWLGQGVRKSTVGRS